MLVFHQVVDYNLFGFHQEESNHIMNEPMKHPSALDPRRRMMDENILKRPRFMIWDPELPTMDTAAAMAVTSTRVLLLQMWRAHLPTGGQIKHLTQEAENLLRREGKPLTPNNLVLAVFTLVSISVSIPLTAAGETDYIYWAYVPNPPLLRPVEWGEVPEHIY